MNKMIVNNIFPVSGGTIGALLSTTFENTNTLLGQLPQQEAIIVTIILAIIGASTGYLTGKLFKVMERLWKRFKHKDKVEYR